MNEKLYVGNLPFTATEAELKDLFSQAGTVASVAIITDRESGRAKGFGFVEMGSQAEAEAAIIKFNGYEYKEREMKVSIARPKEKREGGPNRGGGRSGGQRRGGGGFGDRQGGGGNRQGRSQRNDRYED